VKVEAWVVKAEAMQKGRAGKPPSEPPRER